MSDKEKIFQDTIPGLLSISKEMEKADAEPASKNPENAETKFPDDNYIFQKEIAQGGIKLIHKMKDKRMERSIAMAKLKPEHRTAPHIERFLREARILASLEHPNIVPIHEIGNDKESLPFFTMKLLKGETLAAVLKKINNDANYQKHYPVEKLLEIFIKVCDAIAYAHSESIIHLDLKPENIQVSEYGEVLVLDWGFAKSINEAADSFDEPDEVSAFTPLQSNITQMGTIKGTPGYMSPEQATPDTTTYTQASDIYSLGAILYAILTLKRPFNGKTTEETVECTHKGILPAFPESLNGKPIPSALQAIANKALAFKQEDRYPNIEALRDDIQSYLHGFATQAENLGMLTLLSLFYKRNKKTITLVTGFIFAIILIVSVSFLFIEKQKRIAKKHEQIALDSQKKLDSTSYEVISGAIREEDQFRKNYSFKKALLLYEKLIGLGYQHPELWLRKAMLHAGELQLDQVLYCLRQASQHKTSITFDNYNAAYYKKLFARTEKYHKLSLDHPLTDNEAFLYSSELFDTSLQSHIIWNINHNPRKTLDAKLQQLSYSICIYNPKIKLDELHLEYHIENGIVQLDLSDNQELYQIEPIIGLPLDKLNISNTPIGALKRTEFFMKKQLSELNISDTHVNFGWENLADSKYTTLIARRVLFSSSNFFNIRHLDLEGSTLKEIHIMPSDKLEYLNVAYSNFVNFYTLRKFKNLKTLVIDKSMKMDNDTFRQLKENGVEIVYH